jgi:hypothetical protein
MVIIIIYRLCKNYCEVKSQIIYSFLHFGHQNCDSAFTVGMQLMLLKDFRANFACLSITVCVVVSHLVVVMAESLLPCAKCESS